MKVPVIVIFSVAVFGNVHHDEEFEHASNLDLVSGFMLYLDESEPKVQCFVTVVNTDGWFVGAGICVYDEWGNFLGSPESFLIKTRELIGKVEEIYLHPHFWASNTQNNVGMYNTNLTLRDLAAISAFIPKIPGQDVEPNGTFIFTKNVENGMFPSIFNSSIVDRDRFCYRQMFPLALRLRYDNLCVTVPEFGVQLYQERYYAGAPLISQASDHAYDLYAILSFNYRCRNTVRTSIFTRISFHKDFIENPEKYIMDTLADFNRRHFGGNNVNKARPGASLDRKLYWHLNLHFLIMLFFSYGNI